MIPPGTTSLISGPRVRGTHGELAPVSRLGGSFASDCRGVRGRSPDSDAGGHLRGLSGVEIINRSAGPLRRTSTAIRHATSELDVAEVIHRAATGGINQLRYGFSRQLRTVGHQNVANVVRVWDQFESSLYVLVGGLQIRRGSVQIRPGKIHQELGFSPRGLQWINHAALLVAECFQSFVVNFKRLVLTPSPRRWQSSSRGTLQMVVHSYLFVYE